MFTYPLQTLKTNKFFVFCLFKFSIQASSDDIRILEPRDKIDPAYNYFVELTKLVFLSSERVTQARSLLLLG